MEVCGAQECGKNIYSSKPKEQKLDRIVGGEDSKPGAWPWIAALAVKGEGCYPDFRCGGSLISDRIVLTAAHCTNEQLYLVRLGVNSLSPDAENKTDILIKQVIAHEEFEFPHHEHDIAIIVLRTRAHFTDWIQPICLPASDLIQNAIDNNVLPYVAGWGDVAPNEGRGSLNLKEVKLPLQTLEKCRKQYGTVNETLTEWNVCAGYDEGGKDACQGDSGGPLMLKNEGIFYLIGVVSFGRSCALPNFPGVFTRVDSYLPWINAIFEKIRVARNKKAERAKAAAVTAETQETARSIAGLGSSESARGAGGPGRPESARGAGGLESPESARGAGGPGRPESARGAGGPGSPGSAGGPWSPETTRGAGGPGSLESARSTGSSGGSRSPGSESPQSSRKSMQLAKNQIPIRYAW